MKQEWQENSHTFAAEDGDPTVVSCEKDSEQQLVPLFQEPLHVGTGKQEMSVGARGPRHLEPQHQPRGRRVGAGPGATRSR